MMKIKEILNDIRNYKFKKGSINKNCGITLISLVVTIIILLILGGIALATLTGENGLFARAKQAKENYSVSSAKEKLQLAISDLMVEQTSKGENLTKEDLPKINSNEIDVKSTETFPVEVICENYIFNVDENFTVTYVREASGTVVTFTTEPESYTNKDEVKILVKISNPKGIKSIQKPGETDRILAQGQTEVGIDYKVTKNGHYIFTIVDEEGKETVKDIYIDLIDKLEPLDFTPEIQKKSNSITIISNAEDAEKTNESTKSGIDYCEYYIKKDTEKRYVKYNTNEIENLEIGKYQIYVLAYDRAGNQKQSNTVEIKISIEFSKIVASSYHTLALDKEGNMYGFGSCRYLGISSNKLIKIKEGVKFREISNSYCMNGMAIDMDGNLWNWGANSYGQCGIANISSSLDKPTLNENIKNVKAIAAGEDNSFFIDQSGRMFGCGLAYYGNGKEQIISKNFISVIDGKSFKKIVEPSVYINGWGTHLAIDENDNLYSWGSNVNKQLGIEEEIDKSLVPVQVKVGTKFKEIATGDMCCFAIDTDGNLWKWGKNSSTSIPQLIQQGTRFSKVSAGKHGHVLAIDEDGNLWTWGKNNYGQLGDGSTKNRSKPQIILNDKKFKEISAGEDHSIAIDLEGNIWVWGLNVNGQCGYGSNIYSIKTPLML